MNLHPRPLAIAAALVAACLSMAGCGNKGALIQPPPVVSSDAPPAVELPPETEPTEADLPAEIDPPPGAGAPSDPSTEPVPGDGGG